MKRHDVENSTSNYWAEQGVNYDMMSSNRQRKQFTTVMDELLRCLKHQDTDDKTKFLVLYLVFGIWKVHYNYPGKSGDVTKTFTSWKDLTNLEFRDLRYKFEGNVDLGQAMIMLDEILDSKVKDYLSKYMVLKLTV